MDRDDFYKNIEKRAVSKFSLFLRHKYNIHLLFLLSIYTQRFSVTLLCHSKRRYIRKNLYGRVQFRTSTKCTFKSEKRLKIRTFRNNEHLIQQERFKKPISFFYNVGNSNPDWKRWVILFSNHFPAIFQIRLPQTQMRFQYQPFLCSSLLPNWRFLKNGTILKDYQTHWIFKFLQLFLISHQCMRSTYLHFLNCIEAEYVKCNFLSLQVA